MNIRTIQRRIAKTAKALDVTCPNWPSAINLDDLDMNFSYSCIAGQLNNKFGLGLHPYNVEAGFDLPDECDVRLNDLTRIWKYQVRRRIKV